MRKSLLTAALAIATAVALTGGALLLSAAAPAVGADARTITVNGVGTIKAAPDIAYITLGVVNEETEAKTAQEKNAAAASGIIAAIKAQDVADKDIKTENYSMYPRYDYTEGKERMIGYTVSNSVTVTIRDITAVGKIVDAGVASGANSAYNVRFGLSDTTSYYAQALKLAVSNAKSKSEAIASAIGVTLSVPAAVTESGGYNASMASAESMNMRAALDYAVPSPETPVQATELDIIANITVVYEY
ncbi:MAG: SIMPL domain-containing protein [Clostridiales bacterium]|jgi:uncharacterized protein YggE|nr:SIMPL domain-containing protein [Clostridiales bacterium]